jgi:hypothetical protein
MLVAYASVDVGNPVCVAEHVRVSYPQKNWLCSDNVREKPPVVDGPFGLSKRLGSPTLWLPPISTHKSLRRSTNSSNRSSISSKALSYIVSQRFLDVISFTLGA